MTDPRATKEQEHQKILAKTFQKCASSCKARFLLLHFIFLNIYDQGFAAFYAGVILNPAYGTLALCSHNYMEGSVLKIRIFM